MKKTLLSTLIAIASFNLAANDTQESQMIFYKDLAHYKEKQFVEHLDRMFFPLSDTSVLDTFNISVSKNEELIKPRLTFIHPKDEENIFKLNKNEKVFINYVEYTLVENGKGFIKVIDEANRVTFIPKNRIEIISFTNDINSTTHIAEIVMDSKVEDAEVAFSYTLGEINWKPKYDFYIQDSSTILMDYNIEIDNQTLNSFKDVKLTFMLEDISRYYFNFNSSKNGGIFDSNKQNFYFNGFNLEPSVEYDRPEFKGFINSKNLMDKNIDAQLTFNSKLLETGKRAFSLDQEVDIPAKAKTIFPYKNAIPLSYKKKNSIGIHNRLKEKNQIVSNAELRIKNKDSIEISEGVARYFSGKKGFDSVVIKEDVINKNVGNEDIVVNIGDDYNLTFKVAKRDEVEYVKFKEVPLSKTSKRVFSTFHVYRLIKYTFEAKNLDEIETVEINHSNSNSVVNKQNVIKVKNLFDDYNNYDKSTFEEKLRGLTGKNIKQSLKRSDVFEIYTIERESYRL